MPDARPPFAPSDHPPVRHGRVGVLVVNLGSPSEPSSRAVRRYLGQFLSDRRVIELPAFLWQPVLRGIILRTRPKETAAKYRAIWSEEGSPLVAISRAQAGSLAAALKGVEVALGMRYGEPSMGEGLSQLRATGCDRLLVAPLYPQYSLATTGTALAEVWRLLSRERWMPAVRTLPPYHDHPAYLDALARSIGRGLDALPQFPDRLVLSFHGMPRATLDKGDPYHCQCRKTARLLQQRMGWPEGFMEIGFQSRFGPAEWLRPYTEPRLIELARAGVRRVAVACPGFASDCLETLEEIDLGAREAFLAAGGEQFDYLPCLNNSEEAQELLMLLVRQELAGWWSPS